MALGTAAASGGDGVLGSGERARERTNRGGEANVKALGVRVAHLATSRSKRQVGGGRRVATTRLASFWREVGDDWQLG